MPVVSVTLETVVGNSCKMIVVSVVSVIVSIMVCVCMMGVVVTLVVV